MHRLSETKKYRQRLLAMAGDISPYYPPDLENISQLLQYLRITAAATSNSIFSLCIKPEKKSPYWIVSKITTTFIRSLRPCNMVQLIAHNLIHLIGMSSNEFLMQHALGTLKIAYVKISVEPSPRDYQMNLFPTYKPLNSLRKALKSPGEIPG